MECEEKPWPFIILSINILTELEMMSDARQNGGKARYVKHCSARNQ